MGHVNLLFLLTTVCAAAACGEAKVSEPSASVASEQQSGNIQTLHVDPLAMPAQINITPANGAVYKDKKGQNDLKITFTGFTTVAVVSARSSWERGSARGRRSLRGQGPERSGRRGCAGGYAR